MAKIEEVLSPASIIDYTKESPVTPYALAQLFPEQKTEDLSIEMLNAKNNLNVSASIHGFDTETEIGSRPGYSKQLADLALIKRKLRLSEREIIALNNPRTDQEEAFAIKRIFDDVNSLRESVNVRVEAMRGEALTTGQLKISENGYKDTINYGVPTDHKATFNWSAKSGDILKDMDEAVNKIVDDTGFTPTRVLTSRKVLNIMLQNETIRKGLLGVNSDRVLSRDELNQGLLAHGLPQIATYDKKYRTQDKAGKYTTKRFFAEDAFVLMPDGKLGDTFYGVTAEELKLREDPSVTTDETGNITVVHYSTTDPVAEWIKAAATALVTFPYADEVFMATVK